MLTERWKPLDEHAEQLRLVNSTARFRVVAAGRRSGKTERLKRRLVRCAMAGISGVHQPTYVAAAPTRDQAKRIFWQDLKALSPREWVEKVSESELTIHYRTGSQLAVVGLDKPQRIEGIALDGIGIDEIAEVKPQSWKQSIRPALSTKGRPPGWAWFTGRPKGRGLFYELYCNSGILEGWESFTWTSASIVDQDEIEQARAELDPLTFAQEYEAQWVTFEGLAYYRWSVHDNIRDVRYDQALPLVMAFDFNVNPGVAVVMQEQMIEHGTRTCVIGEVRMENTNVPAVCRELAKKWGHHKGDVYYYGDATGGARHASQTNGSSWELVRDTLRPTFGDRLRNRVGKSNPPERDRVNAVNSRLKSTSGEVRLVVNLNAAPHVVRDFEGVTVNRAGDIEKEACERQKLTHLSDAIGYYIHERYPVGGRIVHID